jgi:hypothetical protein
MIGENGESGFCDTVLLENKSAVFRAFKKERSAPMAYSCPEDFSGISEMIETRLINKILPELYLLTDFIVVGIIQS